MYYKIAIIIMTRRKDAVAEPVVKTKFSQLLLQRVDKHQQKIFAVE